MEDSDIVLAAKKFSQDKHKSQKKQDGVTTYFEHVEGVVSRIKSLGITDKDVLCAAWLHDIIEQTDVTFDQINEKFGRKTAIIVLSLTKDKNISRKHSEEQYVNQLKNANLQTKIIKLCDISANMRDLADAPISKTQKNKQMRKISHYLEIIRTEISENRSEYTKIEEMIDGINNIRVRFKQKS
jgi:(p)ppGpp synthase/HD superfamily hydrolase